jgi:CBS domain containing-hemolysin-like protein
MSAMAWGLAAAGAAVAALSAVADGALLSESALPVNTDRGSFGVPSPAVPRSIPGREQSHRALAFARVAGHLVAGSGLAVALDLAGHATLSLLALLLLVGLATVLVAESVARVLGDALGDHAAERLAWFTGLVEKVLWPIVALGDWVDGLFAEVVSESEATQERREEAAQQFRDVVTSESDVTGEERELLLGVFDFGETTAEEVMVPRVDMLGIERDTSWSEMIDRVRSLQHSRVPVFEESIDEIVGILYVKDLLPAVLADEEPAGGWTTLMRPPVFIPASKRIADLLREFRQSRRHIAIVADEYGGTAGLVTIEDILEELVGEIHDEHRAARHTAFVRRDDGSWLVDGSASIEDMAETVDVKLDGAPRDYSTVSGLVLARLERIPATGDVTQWQGLTIEVVDMDGRRIDKVLIRKD